MFGYKKQVFPLEMDFKKKKKEKKGYKETLLSEYLVLLLALRNTWLQKKIAVGLLVFVPFLCSICNVCWLTFVLDYSLQWLHKTVL